MKRWKVIAGALIIVCAGLVIGLLSIKSAEVVPATIENQTKSTIILPQDKSVVIDKQSYKFNESEKLLTFNVNYNNKPLNISEQPTPEEFTDVPQAFDSLVAQMGEYSKFDTATGTVHLTSPQNQKNVQIAVLNTKGTLTFVKSEVNLEKEEWNDFFRTLKVVE